MWNLVQTSPSRMFYSYDFLCHFITKGENITCKSLKFCFVFTAKTHAVSLSIGSACRSIFLQTSRCLVGSSNELYPWVLQTIISINVCFSDVFQRNYFIFFYYSNTPSSHQTAEETWITNLSPAILNILPHFFSPRHISVHALSPLALWYWCNMLIQLLSFKYDVCHKEFEPKSAAASWNATSSCLLSSHIATHVVNCACVLHHFMNFFEDIARTYVIHMHTLLELLVNIKEPRDLNLYRKLIAYLSIVVWHIRVSAPFLHVWGYSAGCCDIIKRSKKCTSQPNFDNLKHYIVTSKNWIGNVYFMLFLIAWFKSLSSLKHEFSIRQFDPAACYMLNNVC